MDRMIAKSRIRDLLESHPWLLLIFFFLMVLFLWELLVWKGVLSENDWSKPSKAIETLWLNAFHPINSAANDQNSSLTLIEHVRKSLFRFVVGFAAAVVIGVSIGLILGMSRTSHALGYPVVNLLRALPSASVWPVCGLLLGYNLKSQIVIITFGATWPILLATVKGIQNLPVELKDWLSFVKIEWWRRWRYMCEAALPGVFTGLEISCAVAFLLTVTVEIFWPAKGGIGWYLFDSQQNQIQDQVFAGLFITAILGWLLNTSFYLLRKKLLFWEDQGQSKSRKMRVLLRKMGVLDLNRSLRRISDPKLRKIITSDQVTENIQKEFGDGWKLNVIYNQSPPYMFPEELEKFHIGSSEIQNVIQRDITIVVPPEPYLTILFARSWIYFPRLPEQSRGLFKEGKIPIGAIVRGCLASTAIHYKNLSYESAISLGLGAFFGSKGAIETVKRTRLISINDKPTILIHEYVPIHELRGQRCD